MAGPQYSLTWESHRTNICSGLSSMQQNGEFVDMTIAADGHMVKVHQLVMALASPYLKELIAGAKGQHPVIFLNNVSYATLCNLLEYIYAGEALVAIENFNAFMMAGKSLHIKGLENLNAQDQYPLKLSSRLRSVTTLPQTIEPMATRKHTFTAEVSQVSPKRTRCDDDNFNDSTAAVDADDDYYEPTVKSTPTTKELPVGSSLQYTVSNRGNLQLILNRFMYNLTTTTTRAGTRRWRCVHYRGHKCPAFVITKGNTVISRGNPHNHAFHDKKILNKVEQNAVYAAIEDVQGVKENAGNEEDDNDTSTDAGWDTMEN